MNNKGFAVSTILYTILICFMLFLGAAMASFSAANNLSVAANDDLINGSEFKVINVTANPTAGSSAETAEIKLRVSCKYGVIYWPRDFSAAAPTYKNINVDQFTYTATPVNFTDTIAGDTIQCNYDTGNDLYNCELQP